MDQLAAKKAELKEKEAQLSELRVAINTLKSEIADLDTAARSNAIAVRAKKIVPGTYKNPFLIQGLVQSDQNVLITSEVPARITKIHVKEGQRVAAGQLIASLDASVISSQINELQGALELAEANFTKQQRLWQQNIGSEMQYLQAKNGYENLQNNLSTAREQLSKYSLTAPIAGTVDAINANEGELISAMSGPVARVVNMSQIKVMAKVSEQHVEHMKVGQEVELYFPSIDLRLSEKISAVGSVIDPANRTFTVIVEPSSHQSQLRPNMLCMLTAYDFVMENSLSIPTRLLRHDDSSHFVYTIDQNGSKMVVKKSYIQIGQQFPTSTIVRSGLEQGELLITEGVNNVIVGDEVKIVGEAE